MNRVRRLQEKWKGLVEIGAHHWREGNAGWEEKVVDVVDAMEQVERELPRARSQTRAELAALKAARQADPDVPRLRLHEDAPSGWVADEAHLRTLSPAIQRRLVLEQHHEDAQARREESARAALLEERQEAVALEAWQRDVALGLADVGDQAAYLDGRIGGREPGEVLAGVFQAQEAEDRAMDASAERYGRQCLAVLGPNADAALRQLLLGEPERVPARANREEGWG